MKFGDLRKSQGKTFNNSNLKMVSYIAFQKFFFHTVCSDQNLVELLWEIDILGPVDINSGPKRMMLTTAKYCRNRCMHLYVCTLLFGWNWISKNNVSWKIHFENQSFTLFDELSQNMYNDFLLVWWFLAKTIVFLSDSDPPSLKFHNRYVWRRKGEKSLNREKCSVIAALSRENNCTFFSISFPILTSFM